MSYQIDQVFCCNCEKPSDVKAGADECPHCGMIGALQWRDENRTTPATEVRCYDHPSTFDRYTVVFLKPYSGSYTYLAMSEHPFNPQGFGQHGETKVPKSQWHNFGMLIPFSKLPEDCQRLVLQELEGV